MPTPPPAGTPGPASAAGVPPLTPEPTVMPTPTPTNTPAPTATPTPPPVPATYHIDSLDVDFTGGGKGLVHAEFSAVVSNLGDLESATSVPVEVMVDGGEPEVVHILRGLPGGQDASFVFTQELRPGRHDVVLRVANADALVDVTAMAADVAIRTLGYRITGNGFIELQVEVTNQGDLAAEPVVVSADWTLNPDDSAGSAAGGGPAGQDESAAVVAGLGPGELMVLSLPFQLETGSYTFGFAAETETLEAQRDNNAAETIVEVDYVQLVTTIDSVRHLGYERSGRGNVEIDVLVVNEGLAASSQLTVGVVCDEEYSDGCAQTLTLDSIPGGGSAGGVIPVTLPQGEVDVLVFAGAPDAGYRWGDNNVRQHAIEVPEHPAVMLGLDAEATVAGYWSDGTANVDVTFSLSNWGYREFEDVRQVAVTCLQDGRTINNCNGRFGVSLPDGFGPAAAEPLTLRAPTGTVVLRMDYGEDEPATVEIDVPQRVLGVERNVWECFSDRPGVQADEEGCGGWYADTIVKWDQDTFVTVWATGREDYIAVLDVVLDELSPILNLKFVHVRSKDDANFEAHMGVTVSEAVSAEVYCEHSWGCASWNDYLGAVTDATIGVWINESEGFSDLGLLDEAIKHTTLHEVVHALVPMNHRVGPASLMNAGGLRLAALSPMDEALIRLNSHPLVKPGMTMPEVEDLIVFSDELLDPPRPRGLTAYEMVRRAYISLQEAGSARFRVRGSWQGMGCDERFGWADYELADFGSDRANLVHFDDGSNRLYFIGPADDVGSTEYWSSPGGRRWRELDTDDIYDRTNWREWFSAPHRMLASILYFAGPGDIVVSRPSRGELRLAVDLDEAYLSLDWSRGETLRAVLVLDEETFEIREYTMTWRFRPYGDSCPRYEMEATDGEYGIDIDFPDAITEGSKNLRSS